MSYSTVWIFFSNIFFRSGTVPRVSWIHGVILVLKSCFVSLQRPTFWLA